MFDTRLNFCDIDSRYQNDSNSTAADAVAPAGGSVAAQVEGNNFLAALPGGTNLVDAAQVRGTN